MADKQTSPEQSQNTSEVTPAAMRDLLALVSTHRRSMTAALVLLLVSALLSLAQPVLAGRVIDTVADSGTIRPLLLLLGAVFVVDAVIQGIGQFVLLRLGETVVRDLRTQMLSRLIRIRISVLAEHRLGDLLARVSTDTVALRGAVSQSLVHLISGGLTAVAAVVLMIIVSPALFLLVLITFVVAGSAFALVSSRIQSASQLAQEHTGRMTAELERALGAAKTVKMSRAQNREIATLAGSADDIYREGVRGARLIATVTPVINLALTGSFLLVLLFGGIWVTNGKITLGSLTTMLLLALYLVVPVGDVFNALSELKVGMGALGRINQTLNLPVEDDQETATVADAPAPAATTTNGPVHAHTSQPVPAVEFRSVGFSYRDDTPVLRDVSVTISRQSYTALVGRSGAGKSTMFSLLCGFHPPTSGQILIDGVDITTIALDGLRTKIALMEQDAPILHGTLRDNLLYAHPDATDAAIADVLEHAGIAPIAERSPAGLDTPVGDRGISLSGGERQRLAFGRAVLSHPTIVLLDEPTAMLDTATETILARQIRELSRTAAVLVIAHRPSTIEAADSVVMLDDGAIAAAGHHTQLLRESPEYRALLGHTTTDVRNTLSE
ncbi:ABC transporter ATP-binding protein [Rhodococcus sp. H29-C3]|uniref:ABC transporter ATP-binding protein n=1 Tax=Rhodococcus sp. H29-C3 TaxID=3046307 RepID=UPI0024B8CDD6|nr:ABC transporter ATP-binding protein [Rhodococcus sp. H29-C3]MDJ0363297.1 ABC transporter ATP-binding protein [Rhodococcus sp. H29-C3]